MATKTLSADIVPQPPASKGAAFSPRKILHAKGGRKGSQISNAGRKEGHTASKTPIVSMIEQLTTLSTKSEQRKELQTTLHPHDTKGREGKPSTKISSPKSLQSSTAKVFQEIEEKINREMANLNNDKRTAKMSLCLDALVSGNVESFVDFFYLTHRTDKPADVDEKPEDLSRIVSSLCEAEGANRRGEGDVVYGAYDSLASFFRSTGDFKTAVYFYEKCLEVSEALEDLIRQAKACRNLGLTYDSLGDAGVAMSYHERHFEKAKTQGDEKEVRDAQHHLMETYRVYAENHESRSDFAAAREMYEKCLHIAEQAGDIRNQGLAYYKLGLTSRSLKEYHQAVAFQEKYLQVCQQSGDQLGEGAALLALASSFRDLGDVSVAIGYLEKYLDIAAKNNLQRPQVEASTALGAIYSSREEFAKAVQYFEKAYEVAKALGDRKLIDSTRITLGTARGNVAMVPYMDVVDKDIAALLQWKTTRVSFK